MEWAFNIFDEVLYRYFNDGNHHIGFLISFTFSVSNFVHLVGGSSANEGRVEVYYNNHWNTVCDDYWDANDAKIVCKELGWPYSNAQAYTGAFFGQGSGPILDHLDCSGSESRLHECSYILNHGHCNVRNDHGEDAGVRCQ